MLGVLFAQPHNQTIAREYFPPLCRTALFGFGTAVIGSASVGASKPEGTRMKEAQCHREWQQ